MSEDKEINHLEEAEKNLYRRAVTPPPLVRTKLRSTERDIKKDWSIETPLTYSNQSMTNSILAKVLVFAVIIFLGTLAIAAFVVFRGSNQISGSNIDFQIKGPMAIRGGDQTSFQILIANRNTTELQEVRLIVEFPSDTKSASSTSVDLTRLNETIGTIDSGEVLNRTVRASFFGAEGEEKEVRAKIEYRIPGSNALYTKDANTHFTISAPPIGLLLGVPPEVPAGAAVSLEVKIRPRARQAINKALLVVDYPVGFIFDEASRSPSFRNNVWVLSDLETGEEQTIIIDGTLSGVANENKSFTATIGLQDPIGEDTISFPYNRVSQNIRLQEAFIRLGILVDGKAGESHVALDNRLIRFQIEWQNNLQTAVTDAIVEVVFTSDALDLADTNPGNGLYRTNENRIVWTKASEPALALLKPGETKMVDFALKTTTLRSVTAEEIRNPAINIKAKLTANRTSAGFSGQPIISEAQSEVKLKTVSTLSQKVWRVGGPFNNSGPIPPQVETETSYTLVWSVENTSSALRDAIVRTVLPSYIEWKNVKQPAAEELVFNPTSRELVWRLGRVVAGGAPRTVSFQVGLVPTLNQVGLAPDLTGRVKLSAFDTFAETVVEGDIREISTKDLSDTGYRSEMGVVVR